ncbi:unnamed protein product [Hymenolepis diminuta]|uniref:Uncharacterized protein n=1 Tax=Hymenolepis diminuta TaxID=6216 RepID=A0A564YE22_HYMDI|nr:unnamed protein product [Hymenolepis diminuta]
MQRFCRYFTRVYNVIEYRGHNKLKPFRKILQFQSWRNNSVINLQLGIIKVRKEGRALEHGPRKIFY